MTDLFAPNFYSLIQNNIGPNIGDGLNFVMFEQTLKFGQLKLSNEKDQGITGTV